LIYKNVSKEKSPQNFADEIASISLHGKKQLKAKQ
jgi:hypothetical protein